MIHEANMQVAFEEARKGMNNNDGGPFGAVIVSQDGKILGQGHNQVITQNDPTSHAEIMAIRDACKQCGHFHLPPGTVLYTSCEPCPMCLAAAYWAQIEKIYYCLTAKDAADINFSDAEIAIELSKSKQDRRIRMEQISIKDSISLFDDWQNKLDKIPY